jgi:hypothetical protein
MIIEKLNNFEFDKIGYFKYKPSVPSIVDCIREYPITEFLMNKIKNKEITWEIETEKETPILYKGKFIVLI